MTIEKVFPLPCCERCKNIRIYSNEQKFYSDDELVDLVVTIGCEHEQECLNIYRFLRDEIRRERR